MKKITFTHGSWEDAGRQYAYSWRFPERPVFRQEEDCIVNSNDRIYRKRVIGWILLTLPRA